MTLNIRSIPAFEKISESNIEVINSQGKLLQYSLGQPICTKNIIPNEILIILSGEARVSSGTFLEKISSKIGINSFIGLGSLLNVKGLEYTNASSELKVLALSDKLILKIYKEESSFREWCNKTIQFSEALEIVEILLKNETRSHLQLKEATNQIFENAKLESINNNTSFLKDDNYIHIVSSANIDNLKPGNKLQSNQKLIVRGPLPARIFRIKKKSI